MRILTIDNPEDKLILETKCQEVEIESAFDVETTTLIEEMIKIAESPGVAGIAAPQLGCLQRIIVVKLADCPEPKLMINPKIIRKSAFHVSGEEGCLSIPSRKFSVERPLSIVVEYGDQNSKGRHISLMGFDARCVCHEVDHLDGILISKIGVPC